MVAALTDEKVALFEGLFRDPTIDGMLSLTWQNFQDFVEYVFTCAGYAVENISGDRWPHGPGLDLNLYSDRVGGKLEARVEVRRYTPPHNIDSGEAHEVWSKLHIARGAPGYLVTTSDFLPGAKAVAEASAVRGRLKLVNGAHLLRYISYIRGSRVREIGEHLSTTPAPTAPDCLFDADAIVRRVPTETTVLAVGNNRGGVAKTTTALNLALALAERSQRVLLVDMDPQSSLTRGLPPPEDFKPSGTLLDFFTHGTSLDALVRKTRFSHVSLLPAHPDMRMLDSGGGARPHAELSFVKALHATEVKSPLGEEFEWIILDTPPAQSFYTRAALASAHYVLIPSAFDIWAALGINGVLETASAMRALMGTGVELVGCLLTRWREAAVKSDDLHAFELDLATRNVALLNTRVRHDDKIERAHRETTSGKMSGIFHIGRNPGNGATDYQDALKEVMRYVHRP